MYVFMYTFMTMTRINLRPDQFHKYYTSFNLNASVCPRGRQVGEIIGKVLHSNRSQEEKNRSDLNIMHAVHSDLFVQPRDCDILFRL